MKLVILLLIAIQLQAMEQVPEEKSEPSQIFLGHWENNTSKTLFFEEDDHIYAQFPPKPDQYKKFLGINVTPLQVDPFHGLTAISNRYIYMRNNDFCSIVFRISKIIKEQLVINSIRATNDVYLIEFIKKDFDESLRIFIHGKVADDELNKATIFCTHGPLKVPSLKDFAINAVLKNKFPTHNFPVELLEAIDDFKIKQKEKRMQFCKPWTL